MQDIIKIFTYASFIIHKTSIHNYIIISKNTWKTDTKRYKFERLKLKQA